jgi:transcriptional regulator with AAA-type ATPase domain
MCARKGLEAANAVTWTKKNPQPADTTDPCATGEDYCRAFKTLQDTFRVELSRPPDIPGTGSNLTDFTEVQCARDRESFEKIVGKSPALLEVLDLVKIVGPTDSTVLIEGKTGTGKERIARAVCAHSRRKERRFVKMNCASIPTGLLESELFGHEKGAFTGAITQKVGGWNWLIRVPGFLDEVGDIPIEIQPKRLCALEEPEFERLRGTHARKVNVHLVAATHHNRPQQCLRLGAAVTLTTTSNKTELRTVTSGVDYGHHSVKGYCISVSRAFCKVACRKARNGY